MRWRCLSASAAAGYGGFGLSVVAFLALALLASEGRLLVVPASGPWFRVRFPEGCGCAGYLVCLGAHWLSGAGITRADAPLAPASRPGTAAGGCARSSLRSG
jgi:hypothetical protein